MADVKNIRNYVNLNTPLTDAWITDSVNIKKAIKNHALTTASLAAVPVCADLSQEVLTALDALIKARTDLISSLPDGLDSLQQIDLSDDPLITMEFQDMELKRLLAVQRLLSHERWRVPDVKK